MSEISKFVIDFVYSVENQNYLLTILKFTLTWTLH